jgi:hypothetical protein
LLFSSPNKDIKIKPQKDINLKVKVDKLIYIYKNNKLILAQTLMVYRQSRNAETGYINIVLYNDIKF